LAASAPARVSALNSDDLPAFGIPTMPIFIAAPTQLSFPSAHAATSFAGARAFSRAGAPAAPLYALAGALALSRLYLGMHHPSDVLAGALLGTAVGALSARR
jgi:membrane-associated phospholipid phosphatase